MPVNPLIQVYDVIGLGFGPSNLAIAGAFLENQLSVRTVYSPALTTPLLTLVTPVAHFHRQTLLHRKA